MNKEALVIDHALEALQAAEAQVPIVEATVYGRNAQTGNYEAMDSVLVYRTGEFAQAVGAATLPDANYVDVKQKGVVKAQVEAHLAAHLTEQEAIQRAAIKLAEDDDEAVN